MYSLQGYKGKGADDVRNGANNTAAAAKGGSHITEVHWHHYPALQPGSGSGMYGRHLPMLFPSGPAWFGQRLCFSVQLHWSLH